MRPAGPFRALPPSLVRTTLGARPRPTVPFRRPTLSSSFSAHPSGHQTESTKTPAQQQSYFRRLDSRIAETFGIGRNMRITLYVILGLASAVETWFYCFWTWQWWKRRTGQEIDAEVKM
ncbi:hypothetical protein K438DRAFT_1927378 [Mycena galopus ATCC 62051]|nr:hypothetical protein K438DRAFT_1927378 [Mycena galopus ATCC 62051]